MPPLESFAKDLHLFHYSSPSLMFSGARIVSRRGTNKTRQRAEMDFRTHFSGAGGGGKLVLAEGLRAVILDRC